MLSPIATGVYAGLGVAACAAEGELSAVVAHEVRNPLAIISNAVATLRLNADLRATGAGMVVAATAFAMAWFMNALRSVPLPAPASPGVLKCRLAATRKKSEFGMAFLFLNALAPALVPAQ